MISQELLNQTKFEEGLRLTAYICPAGKKTIGYGHNLEANPYFEGNRIPDKITKEQAEVILYHDLNNVATRLAAWHGFELLQGARKEAVIQMAFQLGFDGFMGFKNLRKALLRCEWAEAKAHALDSKWARQTPKRAARVAHQLLTGEHYSVPSI